MRKFVFVRSWITLAWQCSSLLLIMLFAGCSTRAVTEDEYELQKTEEALAIPLHGFPGSQGTKRGESLPEDGPKLSFEVKEQKPTGPDPPEWFETRKKVVAKGPNGTELEALCAYGDDKEIQAGHTFASTLENRRHRYGTHLGAVYHPKDIFIGKRVDGKLAPVLFFRDVGSHASSPHHMSIDQDGRCHLVVADVFTTDDNPFKLLWVIGDPAKGNWLESWLIEHRAEFTSRARPWTAAWGNTVHLVWAWNGNRTGSVCYVDWTPAGFGQKLILVDRNVQDLDMAIDSDSGRLVVIYSTEGGVFVLSRTAKGRWTRQCELVPKIKSEPDVSITAQGPGKFVIRLKDKETREFLLNVQTEKE